MARIGVDSTVHSLRGRSEIHLGGVIDFVCFVYVHKVDIVEPGLMFVKESIRSVTRGYYACSKIFSQAKFCYAQGILPCTF